MWIEKQCDVSRYAPDFLSQIAELSALYSAQSKLCDELRKETAEFVKNTQIDTCDLKTIERWERIFMLTSPIGGTLEERRQAVKSRFHTRTPIDKKRIRQIAETFLGCEVTLLCDPEEYTVTVAYKGKSLLSDFTPLEKLLSSLVPMNLLTSIEYHYLTMNQLDDQSLDWQALDAMNMPFEEFEKGEWIDAD